jgi:hypothetical protein
MINIYFATGSREYTYILLLCGVKNILCSYAYQEGVIPSKRLLKRHGIKLMFDSGAFTAWTKGKEVNIDEYINFIKENEDIIDLEKVVNLDIILGGKKTATQEQFDDACKKGFENYYYMKKHGIEAIHVFHQGENLHYLEKMCHECKYIGISPNNDFSDLAKERWLQECFEVIQRINPNIKTHAFGVTSFRLLSKFPYTSADSSSWALTSAFGSILTPYGRVLISDEQKSNPEHLENQHEISKQKIIDYIQSFGFSYNLCKKQWKYRNILNVFYFLAMEKKLNKDEVKLNQSQTRLFDMLQLDKERHEELQKKIFKDDIF